MHPSTGGPHNYTNYCGKDRLTYQQVQVMPTSTSSLTYAQQIRNKNDQITDAKVNRNNEANCTDLSIFFKFYLTETMKSELHV